MSVALEAFLADLYLAGTFEGDPEQLRGLLEAGAVVRLSDLTLVPLAELTTGTPERSEVGSVAADEILLAAPPPDTVAQTIHKVVYPVELTVGPYEVTGQLALLPGFDPGRALTRPSSYFMDLRDAIVHIRAVGDGEAIDQPYELLSVNRFAVERVACEIDVTFWFPGAEQELTAEEQSPRHQPPSGVEGSSPEP
jgi:hypothetical protein